MTRRRRGPHRDGMVLLCTLHWPEVRRYYLSRRHPGRWDFWVQLPTESDARHFLGMLTDPGTPEREAGGKLLAAHLQAVHPGSEPALGCAEPALLTEDDLLVVFAEHAEREEGVN